MTELTAAYDTDYIESYGAFTDCGERELWRGVLRQAGLDLSDSDPVIRQEAADFLLGDDVLLIMDLAGISRADASWLRERARAICQQPRRRRRVTFRGESRTVKEWSRVTGLPVDTIVGRLRYGWSTEKALTTPGQRRTPRVSNQRASLLPK